MNNKKVYIAGALTYATNPKEIKLFYEAIGNICSRLGLIPYVPHLITDPWLHPGFSPQEVFEKDKAEVLSSGLIIAYVGEPSLGVGLEIAFAEMGKIPTIMIYEKGVRVSRFARGASNIVAEIQYISKRDALTQLSEVIMGLYNLGAERRLEQYEIAFKLNISKWSAGEFRVNILRLFNSFWSSRLFPKFYR